MKPTKEFWETLLAGNNCKVVACDDGVCAIQVYMIGFGSFINGYCAIPADEIPKEWLCLDYGIPCDYDIDVHGGITYFNVIDGWAVYGFDHTHIRDIVEGSSGSAKNVLIEAEHLREQIIECIKGADFCT